MNELRQRKGTAGYGKAVQVGTGNGNLQTLRVHNQGDATIYIQLHDAVAAPGNGTAPSAPPIPVLAGQYFDSDVRFDFFSGLYICASSTAAAKTLITEDEVWITAERS